MGWVWLSFPVLGGSSLYGSSPCIGVSLIHLEGEIIEVFMFSCIGVLLSLPPARVLLSCLLPWVSACMFVLPFLYRGWHNSSDGGVCFVCCEDISEAPLSVFGAGLLGWGYYLAVFFSVRHS